MHNTILKSNFHAAVACKAFLYRTLAITKGRNIFLVRCPKMKILEQCVLYLYCIIRMQNTHE